MPKKKKKRLKRLVLVQCIGEASYSFARRKVSSGKQIKSAIYLEYIYNQYELALVFNRRLATASGMKFALIVYLFYYRPTADCAVDVRSASWLPHGCCAQEGDSVAQLKKQAN